jgi:hypothetical protein
MALIWLDEPVISKRAIGLAEESAAVVLLISSSMVFEALQGVGGGAGGGLICVLMIGDVKSNSCDLLSPGVFDKTPVVSTT